MVSEHIEYAINGIRELCKVESMKEATGMTSQKKGQVRLRPERQLKGESVKEECFVQEEEHAWETSLVWLGTTKDEVW